METRTHLFTNASGKKFRQYFFEFFMLFVAVFCGFLAENYRENLADQQLEKQYMVTLLEDLKADTAEFARMKATCHRIRSRRDSIITYMRPPLAKDKVMQYYLESIWVTSMTSFSYNDRTTEQLKSAGAYSLIRKNKVADSIVAYDNKMRGVFSKNYNAMWDHRIRLISMYEEVMDLSCLRYVRHDPSNKLVFLADSFKTDALARMQITTHDHEKLMKVYNAGIDQIYFSSDLSRWITRMNARAIGLIQLIQKEYHIE